MTSLHEHDVLIIGSGAAGLSLALHLPTDVRVALITKGELNQGSTYWAQGGMAAVLDNKDTVDSHVEDTLAAGAGLCKREAVEFTVRNSRRCVEWLVSQGVDFDLRNDRQDTRSKEFHLTQEGGHSHRRIIHSADRTGRAISEVLTERAIAATNIEIFTHRTAVDLVIGEQACQGAYILDQTTDRVDLFQARAVVLATGGASKAYLYTSNPDGASGDGIAMAWRAGCRVANLEFNQFHPTCLYHPQAKSFLITEAIRGEGGKLLLPDGTRFMERFDARGELAPRDVVARAIDHEMKRLGADCVFLDISHKPREFLENHFPTVMSRCLEFGIDISAQPIPVVPAAHYTCGGIVVDNHSQTDIGALYAVGEASSTGLHGANRMASNSLLECIVYAEAAARHIAAALPRAAPPAPPAPWDESQVTDSDEDVVISHNWDELRRFMWDYVGIVRTNKRLQRAQHRVALLQREIAEYYGNYKVSNDLLELRNLAMVAELMIRCAIERKESRGLHYTLDYPKLLEEALDTVLTPVNSPL
ncbi:MAG: L-aspartate oxidase [Gammaproteobacteria bacterium]|nr:L-aspartate oxidase [Gammaproteobacteria bacterium]